jgi:conjugative transfer region protein TrbK
MNRLAVFTIAVVISAGAGGGYAQDKSPPSTDSATLQTELERCSKLSIDELASDGACDAAAQANARRFIGNGPPAYPPVPVTPFPGVPQAKLPPPENSSAAANQQ